MALYVPHSIFHLARLLYVRPETFGPYYVRYEVSKAVTVKVALVWDVTPCGLADGYRRFRGTCRLIFMKTNVKQNAKK